jgi:hypothetical protein
LTWEQTHYFVVGGDEYLISDDAQCTAPTKQGRRCRNPLWVRGQEWWYPDDNDPGRIEFDNQEALYRAFTLRCLVHVGAPKVTVPDDQENP